MSDAETITLWQGPHVTPPRERTKRRWLVMIAAFIIAPLFITYTALPQEVEVVRTIEIERSAHSLYALVSGPRSFIRWSARSYIDPKVQYIYSGPPIGVGANLQWKSYDKTVGSGSHTVIAAIQNHQIISLIKYSDMNMGEAKSEITIDPYVHTSVVTLRYTLDTKANPFLRWAGVLGMKKDVGSNYEMALTNLKKLALSMPDRDFSGLMIDGVIDNHAPALRAVTGNSDRLESVKNKLEAFRETAGLEAVGQIYTRPYPEKPAEQIVYLPVK